MQVIRSTLHAGNLPSQVCACDVTVVYKLPLYL